MDRARGIPKRTNGCPPKFNNTFRGRDSDLQERRKNLGNVEVHDEEYFRCLCGNACENRIDVVGECPLYKEEREAYSSTNWEDLAVVTGKPSNHGTARRT